jgi:acylphosphatase
MKKAMRLHLTGNMQSMFYKQFVKQAADGYNVKGFLRILGNGKVEIFLEGESGNVDTVADIMKKGPKFATVRNVEEIPERLQDFKDFRVINF